MIRSVAAFIIDFQSTQEACELSLQLSNAYTGTDWTLTVFHVDNGNSIPVTLSEGQKQHQVHLIRHSENLGYAGALEKALIFLCQYGKTVFEDDTKMSQESQQPVHPLLSSYDAYWLLNADLEVPAATLAGLVRVLQAHPKIGAIGPRVLKGHTGKVWGDRGVIRPWIGMTAMEKWPRGGVLPRWSYIPGCSILMRKTALEAVGGMSTRYRLYYEETDFCVQLQKQNWDLWVEPSCVVYHRVKSLKESVPARHYAFYFCRNHLYFWSHNFQISWMLQWPRLLFVILKELILPLRKAQSIGVILDRLKYIAMGFFDGFLFLKHRYTYFEKKFFIK